MDQESLQLQSLGSYFLRASLLFY